MLLDFRIDWGYQYLYSRRQYHPVFVWDGSLTCDGGEINRIFQLDYPYLIFGPGQCAREAQLPKPEWKSRTQRGVSGIRVEAEVESDGVFHLETESGTVTFNVVELCREGRLRFPIGPKYLGCAITVTRSGFLWFRPSPAPGEQVWTAEELPLERHNWQRMDLAWLAPGAEFSLAIEVPTPRKSFSESVLHMEAMAAPGAYTPDGEQTIHDYFEIELELDRKPAAKIKRYFREHDFYMQMLEDVWCRFSCPPGKHILTVRNRHANGWLLFSRITHRRAEYGDLELSLPQWILSSEEQIGHIFSAFRGETLVRIGENLHRLNLRPGWNEFHFSAPSDGRPLEIVTANDRRTIHEVYDLENETPQVTVGADLTVVPHDDTGIMDWLLNYTKRTQLGNLIVFRSFLRDAPGISPLAKIPGALLRKWGEYCHAHGLVVEAATDYENGELAAGAGALMHSAGKHEFPGAVYARDPKEPWSSSDMKSAAEHFLEYLRPQIAEAKRSSGRSAFGDAGGGARYCYMAGVDFLRSETMVPHTQHLCSQARPAAEFFRDCEWGVHIAIQHAVQPYGREHLRQYFLSLYLPWMMGAKMFYEEDSLFLMFKEERQCWDDELPREKRRITREFFKFAKTHPRRGRCVRRIAFLEGRYAAPFNGFICGAEQDPDYSVWGLFGNSAPEWGHRQPEKCRQILDVLMPGASTHPLRQKPEMRRFYFSGTPYGDFDETPIEASTEFLSQYRLLLNLGWNTMLEEDYDKLIAFVKNGGTLFSGLPQFSRHVRRDFLKSMDDLALFHDGDLKELCGIRVRGRGAPYSGKWESVQGKWCEEPELSALPNHSPLEDGEAAVAEFELAGAEVVIRDAKTKAPLLVRFQLGLGTVYLLTIWAYPGHEAFQRLSAAIVKTLADAAKGDCYVADSPAEIFWTRWEIPDGSSELMLLNTDWTTRGNHQTVSIHAEKQTFSIQAQEGVPHRIRIFDDFAVSLPQAVFYDGNGTNGICCGSGIQQIELFLDGKTRRFELNFSDTTKIPIDWQTVAARRAK